MGVQLLLGQAMNSAIERHGGGGGGGGGGGAPDPAAQAGGQRAGRKRFQVLADQIAATEGGAH